MPSKKELEQRIEQLEQKIALLSVEIALLRQPPTIDPSYYQPPRWVPSWPPTCTTDHIILQDSLGNRYPIEQTITRMTEA